MKKKLISSVITIFAIAICVGISLVSAKTVSAGGGTWSYGTTGLFGGAQCIRIIYTTQKCTVPAL
ncbi:MAG: hypothetical protein GX346_05975 [Clostridiales bacterium]|nr:hypothetical protein [Clostridiales bacterium]